jgi:hypothetical protein
LPQLFLPGNISREGDTIGGSVISYQASATDAEDGPLAVDCVPRSGSLFSVGSTIVNCLAMDSQGAKTTELFSIIVNDTTAPAIDPHGDVNIQATSDSGTIVTYTNPVTYDIVDGQGTAICLRQSGNLFNIGDTSVTCTATDSHGNSASTSFVVHVIAPPTPVSNSSILVLVYWDKDKDGRHDSSDYLLSATLKLYAGTSCTGTAIASPIAFLGYKFDHLEAGTYCVKVNSVEDVGTCALIPGKYGNTNVYPDLTENEDREDLDSGFPYVCQ